MFDSARKRLLPALPEKIVVITSASGAALYDFLTIWRKRQSNACVVIYPSAVQGKGAALELAAALDRVNAEIGGDVIVLCRGGGSLEYDELKGIAWEWQSADSTNIEAPSALESVSPNPTDRGKKRHKKKSTSGRQWRPARGFIVGGANRHDSIFLSSLLDALSSANTNQMINNPCLMPDIPEKRTMSGSTI